ncbi:uncharacterized protein JCM6883_005760 [Sporobolomyces salmoneus]|uniref:uncharacterized protein n=1 Tax=Sporobolomyces salmoneus TaxID=183962 RepID=UPI00317916A1
MAWACSGSTNAELVSNLTKNGLLKTPRVIQAFNQVDRKYYVSTAPYQDSPQRIGYGATISAPHMHVHAVENLEPLLQPGAHVLDIGSGSGYLLSVFHKLVSSGGGTVLGIDHLPGLVAQGIENVSKDPTTRSHLSTNETPLPPGSISNILADGREGAPASYVPPRGFSAIHVGAASPDFPQKLIDQLAKPGRMFVPVGPDWGVQHIWQIDKDENGHVEKKRLFGVNYIPLTNAENQYIEGE